MVGLKMSHASQLPVQVVSVASTVAEVCAWAGRDSTRGGAGLDGDDVAILRREKIEGDSLFALTDAELKEVGLPLGTRKRLLAAVALLRAGDLDGTAFVAIIPRVSPGSVILMQRPLALRLGLQSILALHCPPRLRLPTICLFVSACLGG